MTTFVFIPGAGGVAWYWHRVVRLLEEAQHESVAVDLPGDVDLATYFLHDLPAETIRQGAARERPEAEIVFSEPCRFEAWPDVPIHVIAGSDDRFFPLDFQRRVAQARLRMSVEELPGGHLLALSNPGGLADKLVGYLKAGARTSAR